MYLIFMIDMMAMKSKTKSPRLPIAIGTPLYEMRKVKSQRKLSEL
jgi:hypothetical protein